MSTASAGQGDATNPQTPVIRDGNYIIPQMRSCGKNRRRKTTLCQKISPAASGSAAARPSSRTASLRLAPIIAPKPTQGAQAPGPKFQRVKGQGHHTRRQSAGLPQRNKPIMSTTAWKLNGAWPSSAQVPVSPTPTDPTKQQPVQPAGPTTPTTGKSKGDISRVGAAEATARAKQLIISQML
jgi:hypothetical protein